MPKECAADHLKDKETARLRKRFLLRILTVKCRNLKLMS